jgi:CDC45-like protein
MGVSREAANQAWTHTARDLKLSLKEKLAGVETTMGIELVRGETFERGAGYKGTWGVSDVVNVVEAVLVMRESDGGKENLVPGARTRKDGEGLRAREGELKSEWVDQFWKALDSIDKSPPPKPPHH